MTKKIRKCYPRRIKYAKGMRFNSFVIAGDCGNRLSNFEKGANTWECLCDCGKTFYTSTRQIKRGRKSCGCLRLISQFRKKYDNMESNHHIYIKRYKIAADRRGLLWLLTDQEALLFFKGNCHYCGTPPCREVKTLKKCNSVIVNGIDRINNDLNYTVENCVSCCTVCNRAKCNMMYEEFIEWIKRIKYESANS